MLISYKKFIGSGTLILICCIITIGNMGCEKKLEYDALREVLGDLHSRYDIIEYAQGKKLLFGRSAMGWRLKYNQKNDVELPKDLKLSDYSDLQFAIQAMESLLSKPYNIRKSTKVFRKEIDKAQRGDTAYILVSDQNKDVYIYLFRP